MAFPTVNGTSFPNPPAVPTPPIPVPSPIFPDEQKGDKGIVLLILGLFVLLLAGVGVYAYFSIQPSLELAQAMTKTLNADSFIFTTKIPMNSGKEFIHSLDIFTYDDFFRQRVTTVTYPTKNKGIVKSELTEIFDNTDVYFKPKHSEMSAIFNQLLTKYPESNDNKSFNDLKPVFFGDVWIHKTRTSDKKLERPTVTTREILLLLKTVVKVVSIEKDYERDGQFFDKYELNIRPAFLREMTNLIKDQSLSINIADVNQLIAALEKNQDDKTGFITVLIDPKTKYLTSIEVQLSKEVIGELKKPRSKNETTISFVDILIANDDRNQISFSVSEVNKVMPKNRPTKVVNLDKNTEGLYWVILDFLNDDKFLDDAMTPENLFNTAGNEARLSYNNGDYPKGLMKANEMMSLAKTNEERSIAYFWIGLNYYRMDKYEVAEDNLFKSLELSPNSAGPYEGLASISLKRGDLVKMKEYATKCMTIDQSYAWCHNDLGIALVQTGDKVNGLLELEKAVQMDPTNFSFSDNLKRAKALN